MNPLLALAIVELLLLPVVGYLICREWSTKNHRRRVHHYWLLGNLVLAGLIFRIVLPPAIIFAAAAILPHWLLVVLLPLGLVALYIGVVALYWFPFQVAGSLDRQCYREIFRIRPSARPDHEAMMLYSKGWLRSLLALLVLVVLNTALAHLAFRLASETLYILIYPVVFVGFLYAVVLSFAPSARTTSCAARSPRSR